MRLDPGDGQRQTLLRRPRNQVWATGSRRWSTEGRTAPGPVVAGDRAPDGTVDGVRLFEPFRGPHWTLLAPDAPATGAETDAVHVLAGPAPASYGTGLFLVRPGGHVGWAGSTEAGLTEYLARVGLRRPRGRSYGRSGATATRWPGTA
ncbi:hypothetical protein ACF1A5_02005 [Streptomyces sp. NPDC014864]|uniref:aromatic-ring hydroxylase C-terminal domain-containing protein n=1 Tax=Streptomyces sp. NPDC014864 TaxID=3364924 RepID=UPI0036FBA901